MRCVDVIVTCDNDQFVFMVCKVGASYWVFVLKKIEGGITGPIWDRFSSKDYDETLKQFVGLQARYSG